MVTSDPSPGTPQLPAEDNEHIASLVTTTFEDVVDNVLFEDIQAAGAAWRELASTKAERLSDEAITEALSDYEESTHDAVNREDRRKGDQTRGLRYLRTKTEHAILVAHYVVTAQMFGREGEVAGANEYFGDEEALYARSESDGQTSGNRHLTGSVVEVGNAYRDALQAEDKLMTGLIHWIGTAPNPRRFAEIVDWMQGPNAEPNGEHRPLFELLARYENDPKLQFIDIFIEEWCKQPSFLQETATGLLVDQAEKTTTDHDILELGFSADDIAWTGFMKAALEQLGITADGDLLKALFADADFSELPRSVQETIQATHDEKIAELKQTYLNILRPFSRPSRFLTTEAPEYLYTESGQRKRQTGKKKRSRSPGGSRTSVGNRVISRAVEIEPITSITDVHKLTRSEGNGYIPSDLLLPDEPAEARPDEDQLVDRLMESGDVKDFLKRYRNDARLPADVRKMFLSILHNPRGNGCEKIKSNQIKVAVDSGSKSYPIWRINPNKRTGLSIGELGRKTRIIYVLLPGENGEELGLLDITNKNMVEDGRLSYLQW